MAQAAILLRAGLCLSALCLLGLVAWLIGLQLELAGFILVLAPVMGERPQWALGIAAGASLVGWLIFDLSLRLSWPNPLYPLLPG